MSGDSPTTPQSVELSVCDDSHSNRVKSKLRVGLEPLINLINETEDVPDDATEFWKQYLADAPPLLDITTDKQRVAGTPNNKQAFASQLRLDSQFVRSLKQIANTNGCCLWNIMLLTWQILMARYSRSSDVVVGTVVRNGRGVTRHVPIRAELPQDDRSTNSSLRKSASEILDILSNRTIFNIEDLITVVGVHTSDSYNSLFQVLFSGDFNNCTETTEWSPIFAGSEVSNLTEAVVRSDTTITYDIEIHFKVNDKTNKMNVDLLFRKSLFDKQTIKNIKKHYNELLTGLINCNGRDSWNRIPMMSESERNLVLCDANNTQELYPKCCIHDLFEEQAITHPHRIALIYNEVSFSYRDTYGKCISIAYKLLSLGSKIDSAVCILMERSDLLTISIFGILFSGAAYVPLDVDYPSDRLQHIIDDCNATILVTTSNCLSKVPETFTGHVVCTDSHLSDHDKELNPSNLLSTARQRRKDVKSNPDSLVYIFYTSGTTGKPKGVEVTHRGLVKRIAWFQRTYNLLPSDRVINKTPYVFGVSEWEFFWALPYSGTMVIAKEGGQKDPEYLINLTKKHKVTIATYVPSMLSVTIDFMIACSLNYSTDMRLVVCCGEALQVDTCYKFFEVFAPEKAKLHNLYGPTEADMTFWECPPLEPGENPRKLKKIPIGLPMDNVKVYVLDSQRQPVPPGVPGELYFGGATTARGYLGMPQLTLEKFVKCPFKQPQDCDRMYRTGDCVRWLPDMSNLEFLGRVDNQVKLRGFRIELGEIESVLLETQDVSKVAVIIEGKDASMRLVAYVSPETVSVDLLKNNLKSKLPDYMIPSIIMPIPTMPLTSRGKLDRNALPEPVNISANNNNDKQECVPATTKIQKEIEKIWQKILNRDEPLSIYSDFVMLGGNSLLAGKATTEIRRSTGHPIPATAMYTHSTIAKIAELVEKSASRDDSENDTHGNSIPGNLNKPFNGLPCTPFKMFVLFMGMIASLIIGQASFIPAWIILYNVYYDSGVLLTCIAAVPALATTFVLVTVYSVLLKRIVLWRTTPGSYPVYSWYYIRWWFSNNLVRNTCKMIGPLCEGTELFNWYLRLIGANIGVRVDINTDEIDTPDLLTIGSDTEIERKAVVICHQIENGMLILLPVIIENCCRVQPVAHVTPGSRVDAGSTVGPLSTTGSGSHKNIRKHEGGPALIPRTPTQDVVRITFGVPFILILEAVAMYPCILLLEWIWYSGLPISNANSKYITFCFILSWVYKFVLPDVLFLLVVLLKTIFIGRFTAGKRSYTFWDEFRRWLWERLLHVKYFEDALQPWINTELLSCKYRLLGVKMGYKVHADYVDMVEHDLVTIGADSVFGSKVVLNTCDHVESRPIVVQREGQILDHATLMPGVIVGEGALCGSSTVGAKYHQFVPYSINTGNQGGRAVQLRVKSVSEAGGRLSHLPESEQKLSLEGLRNHHSNLHWGLFNLYNILVVVVVFCFPAILEVGSVVIWMWLSEFDAFYGVSGFILSLLVTAPIYQLLYIMEGLLILAIKWIVMGSYREGNYPFYGQYHRKWVVMMTCKLVMNHLVEEMNGTPFIVWFMRLNGSKVGNDVICFGDALEYDLLEIGDQACIGENCDITCHTVENMVVKTSHVKIGKQCTLHVGAFIMPGGSMLEGSVLMHASQVLKGETVAANDVYAGQPAEPVKRYPPVLSELNRDFDIEVGVLTTPISSSTPLGDEVVTEAQKMIVEAF